MYPPYFTNNFISSGMALMALSKLRASPGLYRYPLSAEILAQHEEVEETLDGGVHTFSELEAEFVDLRTQLQSAEEHVHPHCYACLLACECLLYKNYDVLWFSLQLSLISMIGSAFVSN